MQLKAIADSAHKPHTPMDASGDIWVSWQEQAAAGAGSECLATHYSFCFDWGKDTNKTLSGEVIALGVPLLRLPLRA